MKPFTFRLDTLLKTKESQEKVYALALTRAELTFRVARERVRELEERRDHFGRKLSEMQDVFPISEAKSSLIYLEGLAERIQEHKQHLILLNREIAELRAKCAEAVKERKILENLRTRMKSEHRRKGQQRDVQLLDAISMRGVHWSTEDKSNA